MENGWMDWIEWMWMWKVEGGAVPDLTIVFSKPTFYDNIW